MFYSYLDWCFSAEQEQRQQRQQLQQSVDKQHDSDSDMTDCDYKTDDEND